MGEERGCAGKGGQNGREQKACMIGGAVPCIWLEAITSSQRERVCHAVLCKQGLPSQQKGAGNKMKKTQCVARVAAWFIPTVEGKGAG